MANDNKLHRKKARAIMPATRILQSRVGAGKIKPEKVEKAEKKIAAVRGRIDLQPFGLTHMAEVEACLQKIKSGKHGIEVTDELARSLMNFKSNIGTFGDGPMIGLAVIMLNWVESLETIDQDVQDVLGGYYTTLDQIFSGKIKDGAMIEIIVREMQAACERYFSRHPELQLTQVIDNSKAFYVDQSNYADIRVGLAKNEDLQDEKLIGEDG